MKKLLFGAVLVAVFALGSFVTIPAQGVDPTVGHANTVAPSVAPADPIVDDLLCDGMTPCVHLSPPKRN
jgi:hypothetical protein